MISFFKYIEKLFLCKILDDHKWTSKALQGFSRSKGQLKMGVYGFFEHTRIYCERCGCVSKVWKESKDRYMYSQPLKKELLNKIK